jgi:PHD/YefM family antitoxin component YafN of YafNO toxin-antitoxin module
LSKQYVVNAKGRRVGVIISVAEYERLLEAQEELEAIRAYDEATESGDEAIPFERAVDEIEGERR